MDYETQMATTELDNYREDLVKAFDYLHENPYHAHVKMPYSTETSELLEDLSIDKQFSLLRYYRTYDQQNVFDQLAAIFTNPAFNIPLENAKKLAGYVADILNETYKSEFFNPGIFNLRFDIEFQSPEYRQNMYWHIDRVDKGYCTDEKLGMLYPLKGPTTLFYDTINLIQGFKKGFEYPHYPHPMNSRVNNQPSEEINYLQSLSYSPIEIQYGSQGYANIFNIDYSVHSWPIMQMHSKDRLLLNIYLEPKTSGLYENSNFCAKINPSDSNRMHVQIEC